MSENHFHPGWWLVITLVVCGGPVTPVLADTRASYVQPASDNRIVVQYQSDAHVRVDTMLDGEPGSLLFRDGRTYRVQDGEYVDVTAVRQIMNTLAPRRAPSGPVEIEIEKSENHQTIGGYHGTVYAIRIDGEHAVTTMTDAPALGELAKAFAIMSERLATLGILDDSLLSVLGDPRFDRQAPLVFSRDGQTYQIERIEHTPIDHQLFSLAGLEPQEILIPGLASDDTELLLQRIREACSDAEAQAVIRQMLGP